MHRLHFCIECRNDLSIIQGCQSYIHVVSLGPVMMPNAGPQAPPMAGARDERRLLAVACRPMLGQDTPRNPTCPAPVLSRSRAPPRLRTH